MPTFVIHEATTYADAYEVEAATKEEAVAKHKAGKSDRVGPSTSDSEIVEVTQRGRGGGLMARHEITYERPGAAGSRGWRPVCSCGWRGERYGVNGGKPFAEAAGINHRKQHGAAVAEDRLRAQAHVVGLLNEAEAVLTGWVLSHDREAVSKLTEPLYALCDRDEEEVKT